MADTRSHAHKNVTHRLNNRWIEIERGIFHYFSGNELRVGNGKNGVKGLQNALVFP